MQSGTFYITTTLPYVNAKPHIGFALEIITADVLARYYRLLDYQVLFNTGTDEHGQKIYDRATAENKDPQAFVDEHAASFAQLQSELDLSFDHFIRTTDAQHVKAAQAFWLACEKNGFIYKGKYQTLYCIGCELEKQVSDLVNDVCPLHPNQPIEHRQEDNYFFRFSEFQQPLLALYRSQPELVKPAGKMREIESFVKDGLNDFSISRLKQKMPWGIPVPNDPEHVMYVWFDALVNYLSTLGWPTNTTMVNQFWPGTQIAGKDNLRQQAAMWQAMLLAAKQSPSQEILMNGFISVDGQKMSKSLGNVIEPQTMVNRYGTDATRWLLFSLGPVGGDMDVSWKRFDESYTATLVNGLGNLCSRIAKLAALTPNLEFSNTPDSTRGISKAVQSRIERRTFSELVEWYSDQIHHLDQYLSESKPWEKSDEDRQKAVDRALTELKQLLVDFGIIMPSTTNYLLKHFSTSPIKPLKPVFPRLVQ